MTWQPYAGVPAIVALHERRLRATTRSGTAASSTTRSAPAGSTASRTSPRRACCAWTSPTGDAVLVLRRRRTRCRRRALRRRDVRPASPRANRPAARRFASALAARGRRVPGAPRRRARPSSPAIRGSPTGAATRSSRCAGCASRPAGSTTRARSCSSGPGRVRGHAAEPLRRSGRRARVQLRRRLALVRGRRARLPSRASRPTGGSSARATCARLERAVRAILDGYVRGTRYGIRVDDDGLLAARRAGRAAHLDGREGRRLGRDAAHRQAGRDPGALAQRAPDRASAFTGEYGRSASAGCAAFADALLERGRGLPATTWSTSTTWPDASTRPSGPNQIFAVGGLPFPLLDGDAGARGRGRRRARGSDAARPAHARPRTRPATGARYEGGVPRATAPTTRARSGRGCSGPFVEAWVRVRGGDAGGAARGARALPRAAARRISTTPASATSPRSPTPSPAHARGAARSRRGRSARRCGSIYTSSCPAGVAAAAGLEALQRMSPARDPGPRPRRPRRPTRRA